MKKNRLILFMLFLAIGSGSAIAQKYSTDDFVNNSSSNKYTVVGSSADGLDSPVDLDFNKQNMSELWVISMRTENRGGNTVTFRDVGKASQKAYLKTDGNAWHFMSLPTAIAFGDKGDWANSPGVWDANHRAGTTSPFTGPALWSSDFAVYAQPSGGNGSHLDMLHGSPYSVGIAWEIANQYWLFDGHNGHLVMYDFVDDHGPGNSDHDDGRLRRYPEIKLKRDGLIPSHMEFDAARKWLYINDIGNAQIIRVDITTGNIKGRSVTRPSEVLAENNDMENVTMEVVASKGLTKPCGLDVFGDRLIVTDNATSEILVYDISKSGFPLVGRIKLPTTDVMGVKLDKEGKIWYVDKTAKTVVRIDNDKVLLKGDNGFLVSTEEKVEITTVSMFPNPSSDKINLTGFKNGSIITVYDMTGRKAMSISEIDYTEINIDISELENGMYIVSVESEGSIVHQSKLIKE